MNNNMRDSDAFEQGFAEALLQRIALTLKQDVGPAVVGEFEKTQAFMAAVVLEKLGRQLALAREHAQAAASERAALVTDLRSALATAPVPQALQDAVTALANERNNHSLSNLIEVLYAVEGELGKTRFAAMLKRVREVLRADVDRAMAYAA